MVTNLITVENVSKKFCRSLKRSLWYGVKDIGWELSGISRTDHKLRHLEFWALKDVSIELKHGETLGIIGHNGAGKTTLLRLLNGLIKPDSGRIEVRGRMQALIALGAGFNPVLTGRENVYINGSVLGISRAELDRRFDEIVDFSGIREFIDMPVQSYSSGMVVRLGFSVAAHLEPDILLVDEVLAVGDLAFRTKCQTRIQELRNNGVATILISHDLHAISHVCSRAITLEKGHVLYEGDPEHAIDAYRASLMRSNVDIVDELRVGTGEIRVHHLEVLNYKDVATTELRMGDLIKLRLHYRATKPVQSPVFNVVLHLLHGFQVTGIRNDVDGLDAGKIQGDGYVDIIIPRLNLLPNIYTIDAVILHSDGFTYYDRVNQLGQFKVVGGLQINGIAYLPHKWTFRDGNDQPTIGALPIGELAHRAVI